MYQKLNARLQVLFRFSKEGVELEAEIERTKEKIKKVLEERGKQIIFNARVKDLEEDEKWSKYFFKKIVNKKHEIKKMEGESTTEGKLGKVKIFCKINFRKKKTDESLTEFFLENIEYALNKLEQDFLLQDFCQEEIFSVIHSFDGNKTPGKDGLPIEFYKFFWDILKDDLVEIIKKVANNFKIPTPWSEGVIVFIYKKGDKELIKNWRPITLLNSDYKI